VVTTGGTGPAPRDVTPEATEAVRPRSGARVPVSNLAAFACARTGPTPAACVQTCLHMPPPTVAPTPVPVSADAACFHANCCETGPQLSDFCAM